MQHGVSHLGYKILRSTGRELYRCVYLACIVRICAKFCSLPIRQDTPRYTPDTLPIQSWGKRNRPRGENGTPSVLADVHDVAQPLSDRSIRKSPSFLQTLFAAQSHGVLSVASASVRDCGRACVSRRCAFARGASRGSSPQVRASTRIIHRRGAPALSQALSRRRRRDGQPERASFDRDR